MIPSASPEVQAYNRLMANSFRHFTGLPIVAAADTLRDTDLAIALFNAPRAIVSHGTEADPIFRYANAAALRLWDMDWDSFTRLPSRHSAEAATDIQSDRDSLLKAALQKGFVEPYIGIRISRAGERFEISDTVLWNVIDSAGIRHGQAAFIRKWRHL